MLSFDVAIIGGGLGGLVAAIHLAKSGHSVALFEKKKYPFHKVCGEYVSCEVLNYLKNLGFEVESEKPSLLQRLQVSSISGKTMELNLPLGGIGLSRYSMDHTLYALACSCGVRVFEQTTISDISFDQDRFQLVGSSNLGCEAQIVIGAHGKRSRVDRLLKRRFLQKKANYIGVKYHREGSFPDDLIALHLFPKGYCGISCIEENKVNMCYLAHSSTLQGLHSLEKIEAELLSQNPFLRHFISNSRSLYKTPLAISNISFSYKPAVEQHVLMVGDSAGLISPLCGNGMAMAIHSAKMAAECIDTYFKGNQDRRLLETSYQNQWSQTFSTRLRVGKVLQQVFFLPHLPELAIPLMNKFPQMSSHIITRTHGKPIGS